MRNYFSFNLKGSSVFVFMILIWIDIIIYYLLSAHLNYFNADIPINGEWFIGLLQLFALYFVCFLIGGMAMFFIVRKTVEALTYKESALETNYNFGEYFKILFLGILLSIVTFGIYIPWFINKVVKYFSERTICNFNTFEFGGQPITLFSLTILTYVLPITIISILLIGLESMLNSGDSMAVLWYVILIFAMLFFLSLFAASLYSKWLLRFWCGNRRIATTVSVWDGSLYILGQLCLTIITIGLYAPAANLKVCRYYAERTVVGTDKIEGRFGYDLRPWKDYLYCLGQYLLTIITIGIYYPWCYAKVYKRIIDKIYIESIEKPVDVMPQWD